jgi:Fur family peroxide stress response transcriptional regulator
MATTVQSKSVQQSLAKLHHATNQQLYDEVIKQLPDLSLTSLHRITNRLVESSVIGIAPSNGRVVILDNNPESHDHYICKGCGCIKDIELSEAVFQNIQQQLVKDLVKNELVIYGICVNCAGKESKS